MRITIDKNKNRIVEMQQHGTEEAMRRNAEAAGLTNFEIREVTADEYEELMRPQREADAPPPRPTKAEIKAKLDAAPNSVAGLKAAIIDVLDLGG